MGEYVVWQQFESRLPWFVLRDGQYVEAEPDDDIIIESTQFPGLRLNLPALLAGELEPLLAALV